METIPTHHNTFNLITPIDAYSIQRVTHRLPVRPHHSTPRHVPERNELVSVQVEMSVAITWNELTDATTWMGLEGPRPGTAPGLHTNYLGGQLPSLPVPQFPPLPMRPEAAWVWSRTWAA